MSYWVNTTKTIDYGIDNIIEYEGSTYATLERVGTFPMPVDLVVTYKDGSKELYYIPLNETLGNKPVEDQSIQRRDLEAWPWVNPTYTLKINRKASDIASLEIDPTLRMADVERKNNKVEIGSQIKAYEDPTK